MVLLKLKKWLTTQLVYDIICDYSSSIKIGINIPDAQEPYADEQMQ